MDDKHRQLPSARLLNELHLSAAFPERAHNWLPTVSAKTSTVLHDLLLRPTVKVARAQVTNDVASCAHVVENPSALAGDGTNRRAAQVAQNFADSIEAIA